MIPIGKYELRVETDTTPIYQSIGILEEMTPEQFRESALQTLRCDGLLIPFREIHEETLEVFRVTTKYEEVEL